MNKFYLVLCLLPIVMFGSLLVSVDPVFAQEFTIREVPEYLKDLKRSIDPCLANTFCLKISSTSITEGDAITFSGKYDHVNKDIYIKDEKYKINIPATTDSEGNFSVTWTAKYNDTNLYEFIAYPIVIDLKDNSNRVTLDVLPKPVITLAVSNSNSIEGDSIIFSGDYMAGSSPQINEEIQIIDQTNNRIIKTVKTDLDGQYEVQWNAKYNDGILYKFYAKAPSSKINNSSEFEFVLVNRILFEITASPTDVFDGETVLFSGKFLVNEKPVTDIPITILEKSHNISINANTTNAKGEFFAKWQAEYDVNNVYEFYAVYEVRYYSPKSAMMVAPIYESRIFESETVIILALDHVEPNNISLILDPLPPQIMEGESIIFSGVLEQTRGDLIEPLNNQPICIVNKDSKEIIESSDTDSDGRYNIPWTVVYQEKQPFEFYAVSYDNCDSDDDSIKFENSDEYEYFKSEIRQTKFDSEPILILDKIASIAYVGKTLILSGTITEDRFFGERVLIKANDIVKATDNLDGNNVFSTTWQIKPDEMGKYEIYAECTCDNYNLKSKPFGVTVANSIQSLTSQITSDKISGMTNDVINFSSRVSGGMEPYSYEWSVNGKETSQYASTMNSKFPEQGEHKIIFTVTDSLGTKSSDDITIKILYQVISHDNFINVNGSLLEGSQITFNVADDYPIPRKSHYWEFHDGTYSVESVVSKIFEDDGEYEVKLSVLDQDGQSNKSTTTVEISNVEPKINNIKKLSGNMVPQKPIVFEASFVDPGTADTFVVEWFLDSNTIPLDSDNKDKPSFVTLHHIFSDPGDYKIKLVITDDDGGQASHVFPMKVEEEEEFPWIIIAAILVACGVSGGIIIKSKSDIRTPPSQNTNNNPKNNDVKKQPSIEMDIEFRSGIEKK